MTDLGPFPDETGYQQALDLDRADPLAPWRERFVFTDPDLIYLDGNSLGRLPLTAGPLVSQVIEEQWGDRLIRSWNEGWWDLQLSVGDLIAETVGAAPGEVIVSDSTSINVFKLALSALHARPDRRKVVTDDLNFPTDIYVLEAAARLAGASVELVRSEGIEMPMESLEAAIDADTALVALSHTMFKSGFTYDMTEVTNLAHRHGALVLWDTSHSAGVVPIDLKAAGADLAVGCTYKYLNGGPGSPAFLYVRSDLQPELENPIAGWWGHSAPFEFDLEFRPADGIRRFHSGTMPVLSLATIEAGVREVLDAGMERIHAKAMSLTSFLIEQWETHLEPLGFSLATPRDPAKRGSHVSLSHPDGWPIARAMIETAAVLPDFRAPDNLRLGLSPLYTRYLDVHTATIRMRRVVESGAHEAFRHVSMTVT